MDPLDKFIRQKEKIEAEYGGRFKLVKIDSDQEQELFIRQARDGVPENLSRQKYIEFRQKCIDYNELAICLDAPERLPVYTLPYCNEIIQQRCIELTLYLELWKTDQIGMFLKTSIRTVTKSSENMSALLKFHTTSRYENWINDGFGPCSSTFESEGKQYQISFYSKKLDPELFQDCTKEYILNIF